MACSHNDNRFSFEEAIVDCLCQFSLYHNMLYCLGGVVFSHLIMLQIYGEILDIQNFTMIFWIVIRKITIIIWIVIQKISIIIWIVIKKISIRIWIVIRKISMNFWIRGFL